MDRLTLKIKQKEDNGIMIKHGTYFTNGWEKGVESKEGNLYCEVTQIEALRHAINIKLIKWP